MLLSDLKENILNNHLTKRAMVFKYEGDSFLVNQYLEAIANNLNCTLIYLDDLKDLNNNNILLEDNSLYVYKTDKLKEFIFNNSLIIICESIDKNILGEVSPFLIEFPKLLDWQIKDYLEVNLPKLNKSNVDLLCKITNYNIYRLDNEIKKIKLFGDGSSDMIFSSMLREDQFRDLPLYSIFDLSNAILKKDISSLSNIIKYGINTDPLALTTILERNFLIILNIQTNPRIAPSELGLNYNQFQAIKYSCGKYTDKQILNILKVLSSIDYKLKSGKLPYDKINDYLILNILGA